MCIRDSFLTLCAEDNLQVVQPSTPAQYFHVLRRQMHRTVRKPLVVMTPKSLLRSPHARSATEELTDGSFREVIDDPWIDSKDDIERVILCTGKFAYALKDKREEDGGHAAIVRIEQLYPFPQEQIEELIKTYSNASTLCWAQEEPENMGAWAFIHARLHRMNFDPLKLVHVARAESASPATGNHKVHEQEQEELVTAALGL